MPATVKEIDLLNKCLKGDAKAFGVIVSNYQELVCAITYSGVADINSSEELAHQTFINAWNKLSQLNDLSKFRPWLCSIARNLVKSSIRTKKRDIIAKAKPMENINDTAAAESGPLESAIKKEHQELVSDAIRHIPEKYREPLVLFYRQRLSIKQIAESLDMSEETAKKQLQRGRKMIKEQLNSIFEETLSATGPKKAFTTAVMTSVAGIALKGTGAAAAAVVTTTGVSAATGTTITTIMSTVTAKIVAAAAVVVIGIGGATAYKQITKDGPGEDIVKSSSTINKVLIQ
ncbi:MAG: sigma-70 family RNA polymerase sigma factor [Planctomycetes bacterium]|nr:sigma-70 family RNA polymerase sigma factor [Planctomycetota bacterium]